MIRHRVVLGFAAAGLLTFASCSSDKLVVKSTTTEATKTTDTAKGSDTTDAGAAAGTVATDDTASDDTASDDTVTDDTASDDTIAATDDTASDDTVADDSGDSTDAGTFPPLPAGSSAECAEIYGKMVQAMGGVTGGADSIGNLVTAMKAIKSVVPDDLKDDVDTLSEAYQKLADVTAKYGGDMTKAMSDPAAAAALAELNDPKYEAASTALSNYFDTTCPGLSS